MLRNTIFPTLKRVFWPSFGTMMLLVAWGCWWSFLMIGGAIIMAVDNPTRESDGVGVGQPKLGYVDALYFLEVATSSCGLGDIVPVTDGGRAIIFIWSFVGTGLWGIVIGGLVIKLTNWIYVDILMASYFDIKKRKHAKHAAREMRSATQGEDDEDAENPKAKKQRAEEEAAAAGQIEPLEAKVLPWYSLPILNGIGVVLWFSIHLIFAAVLGATEPNLGNLGDLTPDDYGNHFYFSLIASQTICFGTDYNPKSSASRAWFLCWHQIAMMANTFLFITVTLALLKWLDDKTFWLVGKIITKVRGNREGSDTESDSDD